MDNEDLIDAKVKGVRNDEGLVPDPLKLHPDIINVDPNSEIWENLQNLERNFSRALLDFTRKEPTQKHFLSEKYITEDRRALMERWDAELGLQMQSLPQEGNEVHHGKSR